MRASTPPPPQRPRFAELPCRRAFAYRRVSPGRLRCNGHVHHLNDSHLRRARRPDGAWRRPREVPGQTAGRTGQAGRSLRRAGRPGYDGMIVLNSDDVNYNVVNRSQSVEVPRRPSTMGDH